MYFSRRLAAAAVLASSLQASAADIDLPVSAVTSEVESDWTSVYYGRTPLLFGNDGSAGSGGWLAWKIDSASPLSQAHAETPGRRTKAVTVIHGRDDDNKRTGLAISIGQPDSIIRAWELPDFEEVDSARNTALGDWSALCSWKSQSGADYVYLFGKKQAKVFLVRKDDDEDDYEDAELVEVWPLLAPYNG
jgi:3-phytase